MVRQISLRTPRSASNGEPSDKKPSLNEALLMAADAVGEDGKGRRGRVGYFTVLAQKEPKLFATLLLRVLPSGDATLAAKEAEAESLKRFEVQAGEARRYLEEKLFGPTPEAVVAYPEISVQKTTTGIRK
jgi:hypothetical protein